MKTTLCTPSKNGKSLRPIDASAVELCNLTLGRFRGNPLVEVVRQVDLSNPKYAPSVPSEHGVLRKVVVSPPPYLDWDTSAPINLAEKENAAKGIMPDRYIATLEWGAFVQALAKQGVQVTIIEPQPHLLEGVYTRDPAFAVDDKLFIGSMHAEVRKPEAALYVNGGISAPSGCNIIIEGGNAVLGKDCVYLGVGDRTTLEGALWLQDALGTSREVIPLMLKKGVLHLDCVFKPGANHVVFDRKAFSNDGKMGNSDFRGLKYSGGSVMPDFKGLSHAVKRYKKAIVLQHSERNRLLPNMVMLGPEIAIANYVSDRVKSALGRFMEIITLPFGELAIGDGSYRCATMPLVRDKDQPAR